jgi:hypothetical protein
MPRKKPDNTQVANENPTSQPVDEIEGGAAPSAATDQPKKEWTKRPDPFGIEKINWQDGYSISLKESDANREIFVQFGSGIRADSPKDFEAIKKMFKEHGMYWDGKVQGWAKGLKQGITPLIREQNRDIRTAVEEAYYKAVDLEEAVRGPSLSQQGRERGGQVR